MSDVQIFTRYRNGVLEFLSSSDSSVIASLDLVRGLRMENQPMTTARNKAIVINNATLKGLPNSGGIEVVPAPGEGKLILPEFGWVRLNWSADYASIDSSAILKLGETYLGDLRENPEGNVTALLANGTSSFSMFPQLHDTTVSGMSMAFGGYDDTSLNQSIYLDMANGGANLTGGHASNSLMVFVSYYILNVVTGQFE